MSIVSSCVRSTRVITTDMSTAPFQLVYEIVSVIRKISYYNLAYHLVSVIVLVNLLRQ
jgi:hypothetical protein